MEILCFIRIKISQQEAIWQKGGGGGEGTNLSKYLDNQKKKYKKNKNWVTVCDKSPQRQNVPTFDLWPKIVTLIFKGTDLDLAYDTLHSLEEH